MEAQASPAPSAEKFEVVFSQKRQEARSDVMNLNFGLGAPLVGQTKHHPQRHKQTNAKNSKPCTPSPKLCILLVHRLVQREGQVPHQSHLRGGLVQREKKTRFAGGGAVGVPTCGGGLHVPRALSSRIFTALKFQQRMHGCCFDAIRAITRPKRHCGGTTLLDLETRGLATGNSAASLIARPCSI